MLDLDLRASMVVHPLDVESTQNAEAVLAPIVAQFGGRDRVEVTMTHGGYVAGAIADLAADLAGRDHRDELACPAWACTARAREYDDGCAATRTLPTPRDPSRQCGAHRTRHCVGSPLLK